MGKTVHFVARISKVSGNKLGIYIPDDVFKDEEVAKLIKEWYEKGELVIIEIKKLHGMVRIWRTER